MCYDFDDTLLLYLQSKGPFQSSFWDLVQSFSMYSPNLRVHSFNWEIMGPLWEIMGSVVDFGSKYPVV